MDRAPAMVTPEWPLERAHRLFAALGLRHLLVVSRAGRPVGMLTRHDLQQHQQGPHSPACRRRSRRQAHAQRVMERHNPAPLEAPMLAAAAAGPSTEPVEGGAPAGLPWGLPRPTAGTEELTTAEGFREVD